MTNYRRAWAPSATWFFTLNLANRRSRLLADQIDLLRASFQDVQQAHPFKVIAMVVLPDHIHAIWELPPGDADYAMRWRLIKTGFSRGIPKTEYRRPSLINKHERGIWQRRYWEHLIRDEVDLDRHVDYIHINPVKHEHVSRTRDWPHSTFHRYVEKGLLPLDWGVAMDVEGDFGECR